jgi:hypothetical protein
MFKIENRKRASIRTLGLAMAAAAIAGSLAGCASGSFSSSSTGTTTTTTDTNSNPASLPPLTAATANNTYVGTQAPGSSAPENTVSLKLDQSAGSYIYSNIAIPNAQPNPVANSTGGYDPAWAYYDALGDETGVTGLPGAQFYGLVAEVPSRLAFAAPGGASQQIAAMVPEQTSGCITPTATATYEYVTLFGSNFTNATDAAWGTFQLSSSFSFTGAKQYTEASAAASTGLIPFAAGNCVKSASEPGLGYFVDTPASAKTGNAEVRAFLGPTGLLTANLQGTDGSGNPLPLPGVVAMAQPSSPVDPSAVAGSSTNPLIYRAFVYQSTGSGVQYGYFGHDPLSAYLLEEGFDVFLKDTGTTGFFGNWQSTAGLSSTNMGATQGIVFGAQDANNPGLFPNAKFLYEIGGDPAYDVPCPSGTESFTHGYVNNSYLEICSSPAVVMVAQHDGKYVLLVTGVYVTNNNSNNSPTVMLLVQE